MPISEADFAAMVQRIQKLETEVESQLSLISLAVRNKKGQFTGSINGGDEATAATLALANPTGQNQIHLDGAGVIRVDDERGVGTIELDGKSGTISGKVVKSGTISGSMVNSDGMTATPLHSITNGAVNLQVRSMAATTRRLRLSI